MFTKLVRPDALNKSMTFYSQHIRIGNIFLRKKSKNLRHTNDEKTPIINIIQKKYVNNRRRH